MKKGRTISSSEQQILDFAIGLSVSLRLALKRRKQERSHEHGQA